MTSTNQTLPSLASTRASVSSATFQSSVSSLIRKEQGNRSRILYSGVHPQNPSKLAVYRVVELLRGAYFFEEININPGNKSVQTHLTYLKLANFHKYRRPETEVVDRYSNFDHEAFAGSSYRRQLSDGRTSKSSSIYAFGYRSWMEVFKQPYVKWRALNFLNR